MVYNVIGDIHSREHFKEAIIDGAVNIFVGDYFSPYECVSFSDQMRVFEEIVSYKKKHPETILLIGNHDEDHWHIAEKYSRFDWQHFQEIKDAFEKNKDLFQAAYSIENQYLVTHAGVTAPWFVNANAFMHGSRDYKDYPLVPPYSNTIQTIVIENGESIEDGYRNHMTGLVRDMKFDADNIPQQFKDVMNSPNNNTLLCIAEKYGGCAYQYYLYTNEEYKEIRTTPDECADLINWLWFHGYYKLFDFRSNCDMFDGYGTTSTQGPLWIRPETLVLYNIFNGTKYGQIVGHTQEEEPYYANGIGRCDCLGFSIGSICIDTSKEDDEQVKLNKIRKL